MYEKLKRIYCNREQLFQESWDRQKGSNGKVVTRK